MIHSHGLRAASGGFRVAGVFSTTLYTGNGSTQTITNNINLSSEGGLVWIKGRDGATGHRFIDTNRGATKSLESNSTAAEVTESTGLSSFSSTGFSLGADSDYNSNTATYASWTFRQAPKFFDVVTYTGTGSTSTTVNHNLSAVPAFIIVKRLDGISEWGVNYLRGDLGSGGIIGYSLNTTQAQRDPGNSIATSFTSTTFKPGLLASGNSNALTFNVNGRTFVAYLFAHNAVGFDIGSITSVGKYTGNGSATGPTVTLGWQPQWLLIKRSDSTSNWTIIDAQRVSSSSEFCLFPNLANAEPSAADFVSFSSTGFALTTSDASLNASSGTYIYLAIRS
jgi:hypothetical protein